MLAVLASKFHELTKGFCQGKLASSVVSTCVLLLGALSEGGGVGRGSCRKRGGGVEEGGGQEQDSTREHSRLLLGYSSTCSWLEPGFCTLDCCGSRGFRRSGPQALVHGCPKPFRKVISVIFVKPLVKIGPFEKHRDTHPISIAMLLQRYALLWEEIRSHTINLYHNTALMCFTMLSQKY